MCPYQRLTALLLIGVAVTGTPSPTGAASSAGAASATSAAPEAEALLVFAAVSMSDALNEVAAQYTAQAGQRIKLSFAASSTLARQIEAGARADVFVSADIEWMDYLAARELLDTATRRDIVGNRLVLVAPSDSEVQVTLGPGVRLGAILGSGRLVTGDPDSVPVGRYARSALESLGVWNEVAPRLVRAENVRAALAFVARGEAALGIVYETDALVEKKVRIVAVFPDGTHAPITYPAAATAVARPNAKPFVEFLSGPVAQATFRKHGFRPIKR